MFMKDVSVIVRRMRQYAERQLEGQDLGFSEQLVLMYLGAQGSCRQEDLASHFGMDKGSVAKTLNKLEAKGLLQREVNPADKREKLSRLTPDGQGLLDAMGQSYEKLHSLMFAGLDPQEVQLLVQLLGRVACNLEKDFEERK